MRAFRSSFRCASLHSSSRALFASGPKAPKPFEIDANASVEDTLAAYEKHIVERTQHHLGYPYNLKYNHEELFPFLRYSINNLGDPYRSSNYGVHSRPFELEVSTCVSVFVLQKKKKKKNRW
jgi:hypothetical protein